jgi:hypothetical protein
MMFELPQKQEPSRMTPMRRLAAAIALSALLGSALPALAALCCVPAPSHACCAKSGEERATAVECAPCCKPAVEMKDAAREQFTPRAPSTSVIAVPAVAVLWSDPVFLTADARAPACMTIPASPPIGPPVRLRI